MGIYDRDYYQQQRQPGISLRAPRSMVVTLIIINAVVFLANGLLTPDTNKITWLLALHDGTLSNPLMWWEFLTYGFAHASIQHILFNMLGLFFLGRYVEDRYGRWEFLRVYLVMIVLGSVAFAVTTALFKQDQSFTLIGASGAVSGIVLLFILNFPQVTLVLFPIPIPIKAWLLGVILVVFNLYGAINEIGNTAFGVHLIGMVFAFIYFQNNWNTGRLFKGRFSMKWLKLGRRPRLKIHDPESNQFDLNKEVDRILEKIHREGESSLTRKERQMLETASREYQKRR